MKLRFAARLGDFLSICALLGLASEISFGNTEEGNKSQQREQLLTAAAARGKQKMSASKKSANSHRNRITNLDLHFEKSKKATSRMSYNFPTAIISEKFS
jgi:hypothetical protein